MAADANRLAAALDYLERIKRQAVDFGGGVASNLAERAKSAGGLAYEALTSDPNIGRMTTAEFSQAAADRQTPRLDQAAQDIGTIGRSIVTQPIQTGKAIVQGEIERAQGATQSPRAAGEYAGSFIDPARMAAALRKTGPVMAELDVYHGTPHRFPATEANPLGEFDASKIGTGEGAQSFGHGIYLTEQPEIAEYYKNVIPTNPKIFVDGEPFDDLNPNHLAAFYAAQHIKNNKGRFDPEEAAKFAGRKVDKPHQQAAELLRQNKFGKYTEIESPTVYKADLPDEMIDRMLDWDKPLSEQPAAIRKLFPSLDEAKAVNAELDHLGKIASADEDDFLKQKAWDDLYESPRYKLAEFVINEGKTEFKEKFATGQELYKAFGGGNERVASKTLRSFGIPGIRYLDAGSRDGGSGTRNFVVFPGEEKKVRILERK